MLLAILYAFLNKQTEGIIISSHFPRQVASDQRCGKLWREPCFEFKTKAEKF